MTGGGIERLIAGYLRWACLRSTCSRGYWLVTSVYLVTVAELSASELVLIGTFQSLVVLVAEVPCGVLADSVSRRLSLVIGHVVMGIGMAMAGLVTSFPALVVSQCLWGLGWAFSSGADVAWVTDELDSPGRIDRVLIGQARWDLVGTPVGIIAFGALAWATTLIVAIVVAGTSMALLGLLVVARWPEDGFTPVEAGRRWRDAASTFRRGIRLARGDRVILVMLMATLLVDGALTFGRLRELRLVDLGIPTHPDPIVWFAVISLIGAVLGAVVLRSIEGRIAGVGVPRRTFVLICVIGAAGLVLFAAAPNTPTAVAGLLLVSGIADPVRRAAAAIWVNQRTVSAVRATVHSMLSQAENVGEAAIGTALAVVAASSTVGAILCSAVLFVVAAGLVARGTEP